MIKNIIKKILTISVILLSCLMINGCKDEEPHYLEDSVAIVYKNDEPFLLSTKGELLSLSHYDAIVPYFDNIIIVKKDNLFGYIKNTGEPLTDIIYKEAYPFAEGKAVVSYNDKFYIINEMGTTIYEFEEGISSNGSFSDNYLVITRKNKEGFLKFDETTSSFNYLYPKKIDQESGEELSLIDSNFIYDYCGNFKNGYAVVGNLNQNNELKYTHINTEGKRLYDLEWDFANNFSEGYAVVGNVIDYTVRIYATEFDKWNTTTAITTGYMYVTPEGEYISYDSKDEDGNPIKVPYIYAVANDFKNGVALVGEMYFYVNKILSNGNYDFSTNRYFYNYNCIDETGNTIFDTNGFSPNNWGSVLCIYKEIFQLDDFYIANYYSASWKVLYTNTEIVNPAYPFSEAKFDLKNYKTDEEIEQNFPWVREYLDLYTYGSQSPIYVVGHVTAPYNMTNFKQSKFFNNKFVAKAQVYSGTDDTCGLIAINNIDGNLELSYIIPPLYDEIVY